MRNIWGDGGRLFVCGRERAGSVKIGKMVFQILVFEAAVRQEKHLPKLQTSV
jgi:hypothetical protein